MVFMLLQDIKQVAYFHCGFVKSEPEEPALLPSEPFSGFPPHLSTSPIHTLTFPNLPTELVNSPQTH